MPGGHRKVPFSVKQKKEQLKEKRERRRLQHERFLTRSHEGNESEVTCDESVASNLKLGTKSRKKANDQDPNSLYALQFEKESKEAIEKKKELARKPIKFVPEKMLEMGTEDVYSTTELDFPTRPPWHYNMTKDELIFQETTYFHKYRANLQKNFSGSIGYYDMNLQNWQQLWRVLEMSDVMLIIVDIRYPTLLFPPSLYKHVINDLEKHIILVLNKIDMAPPSVVLAWKHYFKERYSDLHVICFTSFPLQTTPSENSMQAFKRRQRSVKMAAEGSLQLLQVCEKIVQNSVDLSTWNHKLHQELNDMSSDEEEIASKVVLEKLDTFYKKEEKFKDGVLTIGCVGHPNVGKSSVINALVGKKVVSVSRTPGHTKYFQTIFLTPTVKLCDCPGLVFPSIAQRPLQIIAGSYPIAQVREPYSTIQFLAERMPLPKLLRLRDDGESEWSAWTICEALAEKRGFKTAKAARNDTYRAANAILRLALSGQLCLGLRPPNFVETKEQWENHPELEEIKQQQLRYKTSPEVEELNEDSEEWSEESESDLSDDDAEDADSETSENCDPITAQSTNKFAALSAE